jgi:hypothetical protein
MEDGGWKLGVMKVIRRLFVFFILFRVKLMMPLIINNYS